MYVFKEKLAIDGET